MPAPGGHGPGPGGPGGHGIGFMVSHPPVRPGNSAGHGKDEPPRRTTPKKEHNFLPTVRARRVSYSLAILAMIMGTFVVFGNILGNKIWQVGPFILDAGILVFPLAWTAQDIMVQVFYEETTNFFCRIIAGINLIAMMFLFLAALLPVAPNIDNPDFQTIFHFSWTVFIASSAGYLLRSLVNNKIFDAMRTTTDERKDITLRAIVSSFCGRIFDSVIFTFIAFFGRNNILGILQQALMSFIAATAIEALLSWLITKPVSLWLIDFLKSSPAASPSTTK